MLKIHIRLLKPLIEPAMYNNVHDDVKQKGDKCDIQYDILGN